MEFMQFNNTVNASSIDGDFVIPLANLRQHMVVAMGGVAVGISPTDNLLNKCKHNAINQMIRKTFNRRNIPFLVVGEWSNTNHRWHYHGFMKPKDMKQLESIKRALNNQIGRTVTEQIKHHDYYLDYMLKCYETEYVLQTVQPFQEDSYVTNIQFD